ncbi:Histidine ammonia-lyase [hydrothermal vent metagenome]|uniref:Histidine ammonia-lyase n=1 Tax=hydrothermal vent metagenome TaxID=652676 RepID=A0A3B0V311_9ZZZZ
MTNQTQIHQVTLDYYSLDDLRTIAKNLPRLKLHPDVITKIETGAAFVLEKAAEDRYIYGTNTGFGSLCETRVENEEMEMLQYNHVVSHAVGVGEIVPESLSRLMMFIKFLTFRTGHTGISMAPVQRLIDMWNNDIMPAIPKKGTVGASGDLAPLAHMALPLLGLGKVHYKGELVETAVILQEMDWKPLKLKPKEGLALTNGVQYINARGAQCLMRIEEMMQTADLFAAMSSQAFSTSETFY